MLQKERFKVLQVHTVGEFNFIWGIWGVVLNSAIV